MNRIQSAFQRMELQVRDRIAQGLTTAEKVRETCAKLDMDVHEYARFQELKSLAVADGKLTLEEGQTVYAALGTAPSHFNAQPVHVKAVLTGLFRELLERAMVRA